MKGTIAMKIRKILAALAATVVAVSAMAVSAFAVEINKDMNNDGYDYDNFAIRSYPETEYFAITNKPVNESPHYMQ